jgi:hypothetical protein
MWWRLLGVAVVLLGAGGAIGYVAADDSAEGPAQSSVLEPVPAVSPSVPTPTQFVTLPDPTAAPLAPDLPSHEEELRITDRGAGVSLAVPDGWISNRLVNSNTWNFVPEINVKNTYVLRVELKIGQRVAATVFKQTRIEALESAEDEGNLKDLQITAQTDTSIVASYIDITGYRRLTTERWLADASGIAYADIAVTGRLTDEEGLGDLLVRVAESVVPVAALPEETPSIEGLSTGTPSP